MADTIRTGIVGATVTQGGSGWGANAHVPALRLLPHYALLAVCTAHEDTAQASKEKFGAELAFHDMDAMVHHPEIDLVTVCAYGCLAIKTSSWPACVPIRPCAASGPWAPPWQKPRRWRPLRRRTDSRPSSACRRAATRR
jgi:hypothetical protein